MNVFQRFWSINPHTRNCYTNPIQAQQVICFPIPKSVLVKNAISFLNFNTESPEGKHYEMAFQSLLYAASRMRKVAEEKKLTVDKMASVRLETVYSDNEENPKVLQYRLWIFTHSASVGLGDGIELMLKENSMIGSDEDPQSKGRPAPTPKKGADKWQNSLAHHKHYKLVSNKSFWATNICDLYTGTTRVGDQLDKVESVVAGLGSLDNPACPANIFNVADAIMLHTPANANSFQKDVRNYRIEDMIEGETKFSFPEACRHLPNHVFRISLGECAPSIFCHKYLPDYQEKLEPLRLQTLRDFPSLAPGWTRRVGEDGQDICVLEGPDQQNRSNILAQDSIRNEPTEDERPFDITTLLPSHLESASDLMNNRTFQYFFTNDFKILRGENEKILKEMKLITDPELFKQKTEEFEEQAFENFEGRCWSADSDISRIGHLIRSWLKSPEADTLTIKHIKFDTDLSPFGNMIAREMEYYDDFLFISSMHKNFFIFNHAKLDAYRHSNDLHFNVFATGVGGTSKSFLFDLVEKLSVPKTTEQLSHETLRANNIDDDNNDTIIMMNEIPEGMIEKGTGGEKASAFKERLTSLKVTTRSFDLNEETGKRGHRTSESECIGVWFGATNDDFSKIDEALMTRFFQSFFTENARDERDITSLMYAGRTMTDREKAKMSEFIAEKKMEQARYFLVEKLIMTRCLPQINEVPAQTFFRKFMEKLRADGHSCHNRTLDRMMIMSRILTICYALEVTFNIPTGIHYGKPFAISQLKDIKPFLAPTWEILHFVSGLFTDQLVNPVENDIFAVIKEMHLNSKDPKRFREVASSSEETGEHLPKGQDILNSARFQSQNIDFDNADSNLSNSHFSRKQSIDFNYVSFRMSIQKITEEVYRIMEGMENRPSPNQIRAIIVSLKGRTSKSRNFIKRDAKDKEPELDVESPITSSPAMITETDNICFHYSLLINNDRHTDKIVSYLKSMWYKQTLSQKLIYGTTVEGQPQLFKVLLCKPNPDQVFTIGNILHLTNCARIMLYNADPDALSDKDRRGKEMDIFDVDFDTKTIMDQLDNMEIPWTKENIKKYHPCGVNERENEWMVENIGFQDTKDGAPLKIKNTFNYYIDFIAEHKLKKDLYHKAITTVGQDFEKNFSQFFVSNRRRTRGNGSQDDNSSDSIRNIQFSLGLKRKNANVGDQENLPFVIHAQNASQNDAMETENSQPLSSNQDNANPIFDQEASEEYFTTQAASTHVAKKSKKKKSKGDKKEKKSKKSKSNKKDNQDVASDLPSKAALYSKSSSMGNVAQFSSSITQPEISLDGDMFDL